MVFKVLPSLETEMLIPRAKAKFESLNHSLTIID